MRSLAGGTPQVNRQHRQQVCHRLTQGRRPGRKRSGGAHDDKLASTERRDDDAERPKAPYDASPTYAARRLSAANTAQLGRVERLRDSVRRVSARRPPTSASHQPPRDIRRTAGPCTGENPALGRVRAGDLQLGVRPARHRPTRLADHAGSMPTSRGGDSCRPTLGEPTALRRTQLGDEVCRMPARVGSTPWLSLIANQGRNADIVVPANGSHQLRGG